MSFYGDITLISGTAHPELAASIAAELDISLADAHVGRFPDEEIDIKCAAHPTPKLSCDSADERVANVPAG